MVNGTAESEGTCATRASVVWVAFAVWSKAGKEDMKVTPQELERLGIAITGSANWIRPLATMMGFRPSECLQMVVRTN